MLLKKMFRDMRVAKVQFVSIFILAFLGVFVFSGMRAQWEGMRVCVDTYYQDRNLADLFVMGVSFGGEELAAVEALDNVSAAQLRLELDVIADLENEPTLRLLISDRNDVSQPMVMDGAAYDPNGKGIWLDRAFAEGNELRVGEYIELSYEGMTFEFKIEGLILHPEFVHNVKDSKQLVSDPSIFGYACLPSTALSIPGGIPYSHILVDVDDQADPIDRKHLETLLGEGSKVFHVMTRDTHPSIAVFESEIAQNREMGNLFPLIFFFVAALSMMTTMTRLVLAQRTLIGTLMGMGFTRRKIVAHYVSYGLWIGLAGGVFGLMTGPVLISALLYSFQKVFYALPVWSPYVSPVSILSVPVVVFICAGAGYFACVREMRDLPAAVLRPKAPKVSKHTVVEKSKIWHRLSFSMKWSIRDILRSKARSMMAIAGVSGCTLMLVWGIGLYDSTIASQTWYFEDLQRYSVKVYVDSSASPEAIFEQPVTLQAVDERTVSVRDGEKRQMLSMRIFGEGAMEHFEDKNGKPLTLPEEGMLVSLKTAELLNIGVGDKVSFRLLGEDKDYESYVSSINRSPFDQGIVMSEDAFEAIGIEMKTSAYLLSDRESVRVDAKGIIDIKDKEIIKDSFGQMLESMNMIIMVLFLAAVLLGVVVLYNLGSLSYAERIRELATLRVLGYPLPHIRRLLRIQTLILTTIGSLAGVPLGILFIRLITDSISENIDFPSYIAPLSVILCVAGTFVVALTVDSLLSGKTKGIDMVGALKAVE